MKYAYIRCSTIEQNEDRQLESMKNHNISQENYFIEKKSGKNIIEREILQNLLNVLNTGDILYIHDFSRLSRSTADLLKTIEFLKEKNVTLVSNKEALDTSTPTGKLMVTVIAAMNEFERNNLLERQAEGIICAKNKGVYKRASEKRKKTMENIYNFDIERFASFYKKYMNLEILKSNFAEEMQISQVALNKRIKNYENENNLPHFDVIKARAEQRLDAI